MAMPWASPKCALKVCAIACTNPRLALEKLKPVKIGKNDHIDGCAALLDAMTVRQKWHGEIGGQLRNTGKK